MKKLLTLTALAATLTFTAAATAGTTQTQRGHNARIAHQAFQAEQSTYALTGQTVSYQRAERANYRQNAIITGGRSAR